MLPNQLMTPSETKALQLLIGMFQQMVLPNHDEYEGHDRKDCPTCFVNRVTKKAVFHQ